jgi:tetratricopeptide (TPR) repeat protein
MAHPMPSCCWAMRPTSRWLWPLLVFLAAALVYLNSLPNGFALDDLPLVRDNQSIASMSELPRILVSPYWPHDGGASGLYRPVTMATFTIDRALAGAEPLWFHALNLLLHALASLLAWQAACLAGLRRGGALFAALLFALHPLHTEAVANITGRAELLAAVWVLAAWLCHRKSGAWWRVAAAACYMLALLSKENAVLAPLLFLLDDRLRGERTPSRIGGALLAYGAAFGAGMLLRLQALGGLRGAETVAYIDNPAAFGGTAARLATAAWVQVKYAWLFVWPARLSSDYSFDAIPVVQPALDPRLWCGLLFVAAVIGLLVIGYRRSRPVALGAAIWILFFLPGANLLFPAGTVMAERLSYLPILGGCLLLGALAARVGKRNSAALIIIAAVILGAMALRTTWRNPVWRDNATLALHDARVMPRSAKLQAGAGIALHARGDRAAAEPFYRGALAIYPDYAQIHYNLGELLLSEERPGEAIGHLVRAATLSPYNPRPHKSLAPLLEKAGRIEDALAAYEAGSSLDPSDLSFRYSYGRLLLASGKRDEARRILSELVRQDPGGKAGRRAVSLLARDRAAGEAL